MCCKSHLWESAPVAGISLMSVHSKKRRPSYLLTLALVPKAGLVGTGSGGDVLVTTTMRGQEIGVKVAASFGPLKKTWCRMKPLQFWGRLWREVVVCQMCWLFSGPENGASLFYRESRHFGNPSIETLRSPSSSFKPMWFPYSPFSPFSAISPVSPFNVSLRKYKVAAATVTVVTVVTVTVETAIEVIVTGETAIEMIVTVLIVVAIEVIVGIETGMTGMKEKNEMRAT